MPQEHVRQELVKALGKASRDIGWIDRYAGIFHTYERAAKPSITIGNYRDPLLPDENHLFFDVPIQAVWATQSGAGTTSYDDSRALSMIQFALRPFAVRLQCRQDKNSSSASGPLGAEYVAVKIIKGNPDIDLREIFVREKPKGGVSLKDL